MQVDLQHQIVPGTIAIVWEAAYARQFNLQISPDNISWLPLYSNTAFSGGTSTILNSSNLSGRYVKVNCVQRATTYGSSFYSFNLSGSFITSTNHAPVTIAGSSIPVSGNVTLNGSATTDADHDPLVYKWEQLAGPSSVSVLTPNAAVSQVTGLKQGDYYFKLTVDDGKDVDFDIVKVVNETGTKTEEVINGEYMIYPNPIHDSFTIHNSGMLQVDNAQLFDMNGKIVKIIPVSSNTVSLAGIANGSYCIRLLSNGNICKVVQILKQ